MSETIRLMLVDDHEVVRAGLRALLERNSRYVVVAEAGSEEESIIEAERAKPDVILMDVRLGGGSGVTACEAITQKLPDTKVVMLTSYAEDELLFSAIRAGASGYVLKQVGTQELIKGIEAAIRGEATLDPSLTQRLFSEMRKSLQRDEASVFDELTDQEKHVLSLIAEGKTNRQIAQDLYLSEGTVRNYVSSVLSKLDVSNRAEAAAFAIKHHLGDHLAS